MPDRRRTRTPRRCDAPARRSWTIEDICALGATTDVVTAGQILGISRNTAYALARRGTFPTPIIKAGTRYRVPVPAILTALQSAVTDTAAAAGEPPT
jgi:predicted DNA-binding transcriptional regulator AlpA